MIYRQSSGLQTKHQRTEESPWNNFFMICTYEGKISVARRWILGFLCTTAVSASSVASTQWHGKSGLGTPLLICSGSGILCGNYSGLTQCKGYEVLQLVLLFKGSGGSSSQPTGLYIFKEYFKYQETPFTYLMFKLSRSALPETCSFDKFSPHQCVHKM